MKKVLISGASGLVGSALIRHLSGTDWEIYAITGNPRFQEENSQVTVVPRCGYREVLAENHFDAFVHLAFPRNVQPHQWADGIQYAMDLVQEAAQRNVEKLLHVSSQSLYGWQRTCAAREGDSLSLVSPYTTGKFCLEQLTSQLFADRPHANIRLATVVGPHTAERVPNKMIARVMAGQDILVKGGKQEFSFLDVRDAARGLASTLEQEILQNCYNLGTEGVHNIMDIAGTAMSLGRKFGFDSSRVLLEPDETILCNRMDVSAMARDFGFRAQFSLEESMEEIYRKNI